MKKIIFITLAFILAACSAGASELSRSRQKWESANVSHYRFDLNVSCFCAFRDQMPVAVEVKDGKVLSAIDANGNPISSTDPINEYVLRYATMDQLFSELDSDQVRNADQVTVTYDATYGFPHEISIDFIQQAADDELYLSASGFEKLP